MNTSELATGIFIFCIIPALAVAGVVNLTLKAML